MKRRSKDQKKEATAKKSKLEMMSDILELPKDAMLHIPKFEMMGNKELLVENYKGILEYADHRIRLNTTGLIVCVLGRDLEIKNMTQDSIYITGFIMGIEFVS